MSFSPVRLSFLPSFLPSLHLNSQPHFPLPSFSPSPPSFFTPSSIVNRVSDVQRWAIRWVLGCVNPASGLPLAAGREVTQPRAYLVAQLCNVHSPRLFLANKFIKRFPRRTKTVATATAAAAQGAARYTLSSRRQPKRCTARERLAANAKWA